MKPLVGLVVAFLISFSALAGTDWAWSVQAGYTGQVDLGSSGSVVSLSTLVSGSANLAGNAATQPPLVVNVQAGSSTASGITLRNREVFTVSGCWNLTGTCTTGGFTWIPPTSVTKAYITMIGGGGGAYTNINASAYYGGQSGYGFIEFPYPVTSGVPVNISVGAAGIGSTWDGQNASAGGSSSFGSLIAAGGAVGSSYSYGQSGCDIGGAQGGRSQNPATTGGSGLGSNPCLSGSTTSTTNGYINGPSGNGGASAGGGGGGLAVKVPYQRSVNALNNGSGFGGGGAPGGGGLVVANPGVVIVEWE